VSQEDLAGEIWLQSIRLDVKPAGMITILALKAGPLLTIEVHELEER